MKKPIHLNNELSARLAGYATAAGAIIALTPTLRGQIQYSGIQDIAVDNPGVFPLDMDGDASVDFVFLLGGGYYSGPTSYSQFYYGLILNPVSGAYARSWMVGTGGVVAGLSSASVIDSAWPYWANVMGPTWPAVLGAYSTSSGSIYPYGYFLGQERYIGVRFFIGVDRHYGWIRASMTPDARQLTIRDWAYEATPGTGITAEDLWGPVPTLTPAVPARTNIQNAAVNVSFDEPVQGLTMGDFSISNGNATGLVTITPGLEYTLYVSAIVHGTVQVTLPVGAVTDNALNDNEEAITSWFYDNVVPTLTMDPGFSGATNIATHVVTVTFSEEVLDVELADFVITNGTKANLVTITPNRVYSIEVTALAEGQVTVQLPAGSVIDYGSNPNDDTSINWMYDVTQPDVTLTPDQPALTNQQMATVTLTFNEEIQGLDITDLVVTNGLASNLTEITTGVEYTVEITASGEGMVTVELPAASVTDLAGNDNTTGSASWEYDGTAPTVVLDAGITVTNNVTVTVSVTFNEEIQGLDLTDIAVTNGSAANLIEITPGVEYTVEITAAGEGGVIVQLAAGVVTDLAGNDNVMGSISWLYDITAPIAIFDTGILGATNQSTITLGITFNEEVTGMALGDLVVTNGSAANLTEVTPNVEYTVDITAAAEGEVTVELPGASVTDFAGNGNDAGSVNWDYDLTSPQVTLEHDVTGPTNLVTVEVTVQFDEAIEGLSTGDFSVTNGAASNLIEVTAGTVYTIDVTASADGTVSVELPAATVTDIAGNDNTASAPVSWVYDGTAPTAVLDAGVSGSTNEQMVTVSVTFSETIDGLTVGDFNATNGNVSNLTTVTAGTVYTVDLTAIADGQVILQLPAGSVTDEAGNENVVASVSYTYDSGDALDNLTDNLISLYPNPASDHIIIELRREARITIAYITGQTALVKENVLKDVIDISGLPAGVYLIRVETAEGISTYKFVKE